MSNIYDSVKLGDKNITTYILSTYKGNSCYCSQSKQLKNFPGLLQADYGGKLDCTLTSMTACIKYYDSSLDVKNVYGRIELIATAFGYNSEKSGTNPLTIKAIYEKVLKFYNIGRIAHSKYFKGIAYNFNTIKVLIDNNTPIVLNLYKDNRNYYNDHSVSIVGYKTFINGSKTVNMLIVQDNWNEEISYIDYNKLSTISSIIY